MDTGRVSIHLSTSWATETHVPDRDQIPATEIEAMKDVRNRILGPRSLVTPQKACKDESGVFVGGIAFERDDAAVSVGEGNRCYPSSTSYQTNRGMTAPHRGRKTFGEPLTDHASIVRDMLAVSYLPVQSCIRRDSDTSYQVGATAGMAGLDRGPKGLKELLEDRAEYLNVPRVGTQHNSALPTFQLNVAAAADAQDGTYHAGLYYSLVI